MLERKRAWHLVGKKITVESLRTEVLPAERGMSKAIGVRKGI